MVDHLFTLGHGCLTARHRSQTSKKRSFYQLLIRTLLVRPQSRKIVALVAGISALGVTLMPRVVLVKAHQVDQPVEIGVADPVIETQPLVFNPPVENAILSQGFHLWHRGIDLAAPRGEKIFPVSSGTVIKTQSSWWGLGNRVEIKHGANFISKYGHLDKILVSEGQKVSKDSQIGTVGSSGFSTGPHVHLETWEHNFPINPLDYFPKRN